MMAGLFLLFFLCLFLILYNQRNLAFGLILFNLFLSLLLLLHHTTDILTVMFGAIP